MNSSAAALVADKRFKCTECGKCCSGAGEVWVSEVECASLLILSCSWEIFSAPTAKVSAKSLVGAR